MAIATCLATGGFFFFGGLLFPGHKRAGRTPPRATPPGPHHLRQRGSRISAWRIAGLQASCSADPAEEISIWSHLLMPLPCMGPHTPLSPPNPLSLTHSALSGTQQLCCRGSSNVEPSPGFPWRNEVVSSLELQENCINVFFFIFWFVFGFFSSPRHPTFFLLSIPYHLPAQHAASLAQSPFRSAIA